MSFLDSPAVAGTTGRPHSRPPRDGRRSKVYAAEGSVDRGRPFASVPEAQAFIDGVTATRWFRSRWGQMRVPVICRTSGGSTGRYRGRINLGRAHWCEQVALHELAHVLASAPTVAAHGKEWVACYLLLVRHVRGDDVYRALRAAFVQRRIPVRAGVRTLPAPTRRVVAAKPRGVLRPPLGTTAPDPTSLVGAAATLRRAASAGLFGPPGCAARRHALATARILEANTGDR